MTRGSRKSVPHADQLVRMVAQGLPNKEIGEALNITENTVKVYLGWLMADHGFKNRTELAALHWRGMVQAKHDQWVEFLKVKTPNSDHLIQAFEERYGRG